MKSEGKIKNLIYDVIETIIIPFLLFLLIYAFIVERHQVIGTSMYPTFINEELILTDKLTPRFAPYKRGDVIIFQAPRQQSDDYIKRIIGLPGERIKIVDGQIYINDQLLNESYLPQGTKTLEGAFLKQNQEILVPLGQYFVLGDNRLHSFDSRQWGTVPEPTIVGRAWLVYWPPSKFSFVNSR